MVVALPNNDFGTTKKVLNCGLINNIGGNLPPGAAAMVWVGEGVGVGTVVGLVGVDVVVVDAGEEETS